jgi:hypothetical protein
MPEPPNKPSRDMLATLPPELLLQIATYLPTSAVISLKLTNKTLYHAMPIPANYNLLQLPQCERDAVRRAIHERKELQSGRKRCLFCNTLQPLSRFANISKPICSLHDKRFLKYMLPARVDEKTRARVSRIVGLTDRIHWLEVPRTFCTHCQAIVEWEIEDCWCRCQSCSRVPVNVVVRTADGKSQLKSAQLLKPGKEKRCVEEERFRESEMASPPRLYRLGTAEAHARRSRNTMRVAVPILALDEAESIYGIYSSS